MREFVRELRYAARRLGRSRGFSIPAVATLALGVGATVAVFSVVHAILLDPLPYPDSQRLVWLDHGAPGLNVTRGLEMTEGIYLHYRRENRSLEEIGLFVEADANLTGGGPPERVRATWVTPSLLRVLRTPPAIGRAFAEQDVGQVGQGPTTAILSHGLWTRRFGGSPDIVGRTITLDGSAVEVIGVMPPDFGFPSGEIQLWVPLRPDPNRLGGFGRRAVARLAPGVGVDEVEADLQRLIPGLVEVYPGRAAQSVVNEAQLRARVVLLKEQVVGDASQALWLVLGTVALVLFIACANVANLMLVRAETRDREVAVRTALGASGAKLARHYLAESVLLAAAAGVIGLAVAAACVALIKRLGTASLPRIGELGVDGSALAFAVMLGAAVSIVFGTLPLLRGVPNLMGALREGGRGATSGRRRVRARHILVAGQVALALVLLTGAGLMLRSFTAMRAIDPGFRSANVLTFEVGLPEGKYPTRDAAVAFHSELMERLAALPGVVSAGASTCLPLCGSWAGSVVTVEGRQHEEGELPPVVAVRRASPGYLETLGARLLAGRMLERADQEGRTGAAVINEAMADAYWPGEDPIGRRFYHDLYIEDPAWYTVVGVVKDMPIRGLTEARAPRTMVLPLLHGDESGPSPSRLSYVVRTSVAPRSLAPAVRSAVWSLDEELPVANVRTLEAIVSRATARTEFTMVMLVIAAATALALGTLGLYAVVAYVVSRRTREIGIRKALGADALRIHRTVLGQGIAMAGAGIVIGLVGALAVSRVLTSMLYSVTPTDPATYLGVSTLLFFTALLATALPARRAARVDPAVTLRDE